MKRYITPELMAAILDAGYNIDYIDAATIDKAGIQHSVLILPPTDHISLSTYRKIEKYLSSGGKVIALGKLPSLAPGLLEQDTSSDISALSAQFFHSPSRKGIHVDSISKLPDALHHALPSDLAAAGEMSGIGFLHRKLATSDIYFVANTSNKPIRGTIRFRSSRPVTESWNPDPAVTNTIAQSADGTIPLNLAPYESRVFVLKQSPDAGLVDSPNYKEVNAVDLNKGWQIRFGDDSQPLAKLVSWTELAGRCFYSGEAIYTRSFTLGVNPGHTVVDFGEGTPTVDTRPPPPAESTLCLTRLSGRPPSSTSTAGGPDRCGIHPTASTSQPSLTPEKTPLKSGPITRRSTNLQANRLTTTRR
jgi:hypothetical protein